LNIKICNRSQYLTVQCDICNAISFAAAPPPVVVVVVVVVVAAAAAAAAAFRRSRETEDWNPGPETGYPD
jgi:hypothetical protein